MHEKVFSALKVKLINVLLLYLSNCDQDFFVFSDVLGSVVGYAWMQNFDPCLLGLYA